MIQALLGATAEGVVYASPWVFTAMGLPVLIVAQPLFPTGVAMVSGALAAVVLLPDVLQVLSYREYRRAPERSYLLRWWPSAAWALASALTLTPALFAMCQRLEFLYFQF